MTAMGHAVTLHSVVALVGRGVCCILLATVIDVCPGLLAPAWAASTLVVDDDGLASAVDCDAATSAFTTVGAAIAAATAGDLVLVCPGTYVENVNFSGKSLTLRSVQGPAATFLDGAGAGSVVTFTTGEDAAAITEGFTITNGGDGGIRISYASPTIRGNVITGNRGCGAPGVAVYFGSPVIEGNTISDNHQGACSGGPGGGGIQIVGASTARIVANTISNNTMTSNGGGISLWGAGSPTVERNVISGNSVGGLIPCAQGGGIYIVNQSDPDIVGNLIVGNSAGCGGGVFWLVPSSLRGILLLNNTIADNDGAEGSAISADGYDGNARVINNILVARNAQAAVFCGTFNDLNPPVFQHNDVFSPGGTAYGGSCSDQTGVAGNVSLDPLFADTATGDFHLKPASPAIDAGDNAATALPASDLDGDLRVLDGADPFGAVVDMGADEFVPIADPSPPTVTTVVPSAGPVGGGTVVKVTGARFVAAQTTVTVGGTPATNVVVTSANALSATTPPAAAGAATVSVTTPGGTATLGGGFTYYVAPTVTSVLPNTGLTSGGTAVTVTGTAFVPGQTTVTVGGNPATNVVVISATALTATTPVGVFGTAAVSVTTPGGSASLGNGFTYFLTPEVWSVAPSIGHVGGGTSVTITGRYFFPGQTTVTVGSNPATNVVVTSETTLTATTPAGTAGTVAVSVTTPGGIGTLSGFSYFDPAPGITSVVPNTGPACGGTSVTVWGTRFPSQVSVTVGGSPATDVVVTGGDQLIATTPAGAAGPADVVVVTADGTATLAAGFTYAAGCTRYLAEGATSTLFDTRLAILNPGLADDVATLTFLPAGRAPIVSQVPVPARQRVTVDPKTIPGLETAEFSTTIESSQLLVIDRTMSWSTSDPYGAHAERAVSSPALRWYLAEGATHSGFNLFYLLQNPNPVESRVWVRFLRPNDPAIEKTYTLPPRSRTNIWVNREEFPDGSGNLVLANAEVSAVFEVINGSPIIVERAMYLDVPGQTFGAGHESAGITAPALEWFLAEGATGDFFDLYILVANPSNGASLVEATYLLPDGRTVTRSYVVRANSRFNIWVDGEDPRLADTAVSTTLRSTNGVPIIVERAMWWPGPTAATWAEAHNTAGATATGTRWVIAEGEVDPTRNLETYILVANTSSVVPADVKVTVLFEDGTHAEQIYRGIPANSRFNVPVGEFFPEAAGKRFGALVESVGTTAAPVVVEWAMYWDVAGQFWAAGTNALATRLQ